MTEEDWTDLRNRKFDDPVEAETQEDLLYSGLPTEFWLITEMRRITALLKVIAAK